MGTENRYHCFDILKLYMKISVVIPAYNEEEFLPLTIKSIHNLKRKPDEILVVDGDSTDKTREIARKLGVQVLKVEHRGIGYARQCGIEKASGDVIAFTDADTTVPTHWLTIIEETLSKKGVVGVFGVVKIWKSDENKPLVDGNREQISLF